MPHVEPCWQATPDAAARPFHPPQQTWPDGHCALLEQLTATLPDGHDCELSAHVEESPLCPPCA